MSAGLKRGQPKQIGGVNANKDGRVTITRSGAPVAGNPKDLQLHPDQLIVLRLL